MRVLEAHLEAALNANAEPYLQLQYCTDDTFTWLDAPYPMFSYKLGDLELNVTTAGDVYTDSYPIWAIRLKRGAYWHKVPHFVTSSAYYVNKVTTTQKLQVVIEASIISKYAWLKYSTNGNQTYKQIIDGICTRFGYTTTYEDPTAAFWDNIFYPAGRTLTLQNPHSIFNLIRQKLFIYASDNNDNEIYFRQWLDDGWVGTVSHPALETIVTFDWEVYIDRQYRRIFWRDENYTIHSWLDPVSYADLPIYNMGYLESTAQTPAIWNTWHRNRDKRTFHLKYQDGDIIECSSGTYQVQPFEVFNRKESPSLYTQFVALPKFTTTEGGPLPGTIEAAAPYTPLNVSEFAKNLNSTDNNLQALAQAVDELTCGPAIYAATEKGEAGNPIDDADKFPLVDSETSTHLTRWLSWANLKARLIIALGVSGSITQEAWHEVGSGGGEPAFENSWVNYGAGYSTVAFFKDSFNIVHLKGLIKNGTMSLRAFTLPAGYRPSLNTSIATTSNAAFGQVTITNLGYINPSVGSNAWLSLDAISFVAA